MKLNISNPFTSKKFVYALAGFAAALALALLPAFFTLNSATLDMIEWLLPRVVAGVGIVIGGHVLSDETSQLLGLQVGPLLEMTEDLIEAIPMADQGTVK